MDANKVLADLRRDVQAARMDIEAQGYVNLPEVRKILGAFFLLDSHLSAGGRPPEAWAEGPDAPELDDVNERIDQALLNGYRKAQKANHATILRLEDEIYALRNGEPRRTCVRCGHEVARYPSGWAHTAPGNGDHDAELAEWPKDRGFFTYDENGRRVVPDPLGGPVPGVDGSHLPESGE